MAVNRGIAPPGFNTPVGQFRALAKDTSYAPLVPPEVGYGDYTYFSDEEIAVYLASTPDSILRAVAAGWRAMAGSAAANAISWRDYDLAGDQKELYKAFLALADALDEQADNEDLGSEDAFIITSTGKRGDFIPEGTLPVWGRRYTWDRWR